MGLDEYRYGNKTGIKLATQSQGSNNAGSNSYLDEEDEEAERLAAAAAAREAAIEQEKKRIAAKKKKEVDEKARHEAEEVERLAQQKHEQQKQAQQKKAQAVVTDEAKADNKRIVDHQQNVSGDTSGLPPVINTMIKDDPISGPAVAQDLLDQMSAVDRKAAMELGEAILAEAEKELALEAEQKNMSKGDSYFCASNLEQLTQKTDDLSNLKKDMADFSARIPQLLDEIRRDLIREDGLISEDAEEAINTVRRAIAIASFYPPLRFLKPVSRGIRALLTVEKILNVLLPGTFQELEICQSALNSAESAEKTLNKAINDLIEIAEEKGCDHV